MSHDVTGFAGVTTLDLLTHLYTSYANITPLALADNHERLITSYDTTAPIENFFRQLENARDYAVTAKVPYTPEQIVSSAYSLLLQSGAYPEACREWRARTSEKTLLQFKKTLHYCLPRRT